MMARFVSGKPVMVNYTPAASYSAGDVIVKGNLPLVAHVDNPPFGTAVILDALSARGGHYQMAADGAIAIGSYVFWNSSTSKVSLTEVAGQTTPFGWVIGGSGNALSDTAPAVSGDLCLVLHDPSSFGEAGSGLPEVNTNITTVGAGTLTGAGIAGGVITRTGPVAAYTDTTDTAALILAALPNANVGQAWELTIKNTVAFAQTLAAAAGVTLAGQTVIPPNSVGRFLVSYTAAGAVTVRGLAVVPMTTAPLQVDTALTTAGAGTITAAGIVGCSTNRSGPVAAFSDTTDTGTNINAALPNANVGQAWIYTYRNTTAFPATLIAAAGVTVTMASGTLLVAPNSWVEFLVTLTAANTVTMVEIGAGPLTVMPAAQFTSVNVTTGTLAAKAASGAAFTSLASTNATPGSQAMRTPAQILADTPGLLVGSSYVLRVTQTGNGTLTLATDSGAGFTMTGTMTVPVNTYSDFVVTINTATTGTVQQIGSGPAGQPLPASKFVSINVGTGTLAAGNASGAGYVSLMSTNATPGSQAMRTVAQVLSDTPGLAVGMSYVLEITQTGAGTLTLATDGSAQFTMTGTMTVPTNTTRKFVVTINTATTGTVQAVGTGTYS